MIAYVVACWFGPRRVKDPAYQKNPSDYVQWHVKQLSKLRCNLISKIIFVSNDPGHVFDVPTRIGDKPVETICRDNVGLSYGAWDAAFKKYKEEFEGYFFIEDDYVPMMHDFDEAFYSRISEDTRFCCSLYKWGHAAISNGLMMTDILMKSEGLSYAESNDYGANQTLGQIQMSKTVESLGSNVADVAAEYSVPFLSPEGIVHYGNKKGKTIISPVKILR